MTTDVAPERQHGMFRYNIQWIAFAAVSLLLPLFDRVWSAKHFTYRSLVLALISGLTPPVVVVASKSKRAPVLRALAFIAISYVYIRVALGVAIVTHQLFGKLEWLFQSAVVFSLLAAAGMWLLVRLFWMRQLAARDLAWCVGIALMGVFAGRALDEMAEGHLIRIATTWLPETAWWFALSGSMYYAEERTRKTLVPLDEEQNAA